MTLAVILKETLENTSETEIEFVGVCTGICVINNVILSYIVICNSGGTLEMCVFCEIINRKSPAYIIYENNQLISFLDIEPINEGHVLIVPKQHVDTIEELSDDTLAAIMCIAKKIVVALKEIYGNEGYSIMQNGGKFCDFGHAHFHVFPRYDNDGFGWTYPEKSEYSEKVAERISARIKD